MRQRPVALTLIVVLIVLLGASPAAAGAVGAPTAGIAHAAPAATVVFNVNSSNDVVASFTGDPSFDTCQTAPGNHVCTLRAAIMNANRHASGPAIIHLPAGLYLLALPRSAPFGDINGSLDISHSVTLIGAGAASTVIDGAQLDVVLSIAATAALTVTGVAIQNGLGAIVNNGTLNLADSVLRANHALEGGALANNGTATISGSTLAGNSAVKFGGAVDNSGSMTLNASTLSGNTAGFDGGAIFNSGTLIVFDSTLSNNSAVDNGGAVANSGTASFFHATVAGNLADANGGGAGAGGGLFGGSALHPIHLYNSLLADNYISSTLNECSGQPDSQDYNLIQTTDGCAVTLAAHDNSDLTDVFLGELANNGGSTLTRALLAGSPALDQIPATLNGPCRDPFGAAPVPDQRGVARPVNGLCDIGAYEGALPLPVFGSNLIRNGDAEAGAGTTVSASVGAPNWFTGGPFTVVAYNSPDGFPSVPTDTVPANRGTNFFAGGVGPSASAAERIDVRAGAGLLDTGRVIFALSADLGGFSTDDDHAILLVAFANGLGQTIGASRQIGPVLAIDRGFQTGFRHRLLVGTVPAGTRSVFVQLIISRLSSGGPYDDGYADNLSMVLTPPPLFLPLLAK